MSEEEIVFTDRYQALGIPYPDPSTVCLGDCEGIGYVPITSEEEDLTYKQLWQEQHNRQHKITTRIKSAWRYKDLKILFEKCDGWHFVKCPKCGGMGKR